MTPRMFWRQGRYTPIRVPISALFCREEKGGRGDGRGDRRGKGMEGKRRMEGGKQRCIVGREDSRRVTQEYENLKQSVHHCV